MYLLLGLSSLFSPNSRVFFEKSCYCCCTFEKLTTYVLFDCFGVKFVPPFSKKKNPYFQNDQKSLENRRNMDIIFLHSAKPLDKDGITLVYTTLYSMESNIGTEAPSRQNMTDDACCAPPLNPLFTAYALTSVIIFGNLKDLVKGWAPEKF